MYPLVSRVQPSNHWRSAVGKVVQENDETRSVEAPDVRPMKKGVDAKAGTKLVQVVAEHVEKRLAMSDY